MNTALKWSEQRRSLLSDGARVQVPWIKVTIGKYTFGVFSRTKATKNVDGVLHLRQDVAIRLIRPVGLTRRADHER